MPRYLSLKSRSTSMALPKTDDSGSIASSSTTAHNDPTKSPGKVKEFPGKVAKSVKRQFQRLDDMLHHVTHTKHRGGDKHDDANVRRRTVSFPSPKSSPIDGTTSFPSWGRSSGTWHGKSARSKEVDLEQSSATSSHTAVEYHPSPLSNTEEAQSSGITDAVQEQSPQDHAGSGSIESPALATVVSDEQQDHTTAPIETSPTPAMAETTPPPAVEVTTEQQSLPTLSSVSPTSTDSELAEEDSDLAKEIAQRPYVHVSIPISRSIFLPTLNIRPSFSSNLLTWWISRHSVYMHM